MTYETPSQHELRTMPQAFGVEEKPYIRSNFNSDLWKAWRQENEEAIELRNQINQKYANITTDQTESIRYYSSY